MGKSIRVKDMTFQYNEAIILNQLRFTIKEKTFMSIIGPNGSGKSTLLKLIAKNLLPNQGSILLGERDLMQYAPKDLAQEMAVVPQSTEIAYDFTVEDIILMGRHPHLKRFQREGYKDLQIVKEAMEVTNTWHLRERYISEISGGERQRVIIAKALAQEPKIILLDEPTSALDIHHQIEILELLKKLNEEKGVTIIAVLHDLNLAIRYSKEMMLLHEGNMITLGRTEDVITIENLKKAYNMDMIVDRNIYTGDLQITPISAKKVSERKINNLKVHIVCGGGTGKEIIQTLYNAGYIISIGAVNVGDSDWEIGRILSLKMTEENPFSDISQYAYEKTSYLADEADVVILTSIPIGRGNIKNLLVIKDQLEKHKPVYHYRSYKENESIDYTGGEGLKLLKELEKLGLQPLYSKKELLRKLGV